MTVFLYDTKRIVHLTLRETGGVNNWNLPMNRNDFRVFKDVHNAIEFVVRNTDRKPINMMGRSAKINFYDQRSSHLLWTTPLKVIDEAKGKCKLIIPPDITSNWNLESYSYSVIVTNTDGSSHMLYVDSNESQRGFFELCQGPLFDPKPSTTVTWAELTKVTIEENQIQKSYHHSGSLPASMQRESSSGLHTVVAFLDNFTGRIEIQGSVESGTPGASDWFVIEAREYDHETTVVDFTFEANLMWVRFWIYNQYDQETIEHLPSDEGLVTKLMFRN